MSNLPKDWKEVLIENVFDNVGGTSLEKFVNENGKYKFISIGNYSKFGRYIDNNQRIDINEKSANKILNKNDLVMVLNDKTSTGDIIGSSILIEENNKYIYNQRSERLICKDNIYPKFAWQLLNSKYFRKKIVSLSQGGTQIYINFPIIKKINFFLPPLEEQKKIADILSTVDKKIAFVEENINATEELKKGLMQKLLTEGIGHTEFKDSELGRIPESWEVVELKEIVKDLIGGVSVNSEDRLKNNEEYGILKTSAISNGKFFPQFHKTILDSEISRAIINPKKDHILFSRMNTPDLVGESGYVDNNYFELFLPDRLWQINVKDRNKTNVKWLSFMLISNEIKKKIKNAATGTSNSMKNISKPNLLKIIVPFPPLEEQKQIAEILSTVDNKLENLKEKKQSFEELKKGLMQKLLTGEVRV